MKIFLLATLTACLAGCASVPSIPPADTPWSAPPAPDYSRTENWAALPTKDDAADRTPGHILQDEQLTARADVFYIHPTIYFDTRKGNDQWNANLSR